MSDRDDHWFCDITDDKGQRGTEYPWQPFLQSDGCCFPLPVWFASEAACKAFIASIPAGTFEEPQP